MVQIYGFDCDGEGTSRPSILFCGAKSLRMTFAKVVGHSSEPPSHASLPQGALCTIEHDQFVSELISTH